MIKTSRNAPVSARSGTGRAKTGISKAALAGLCTLAAIGLASNAHATATTNFAWTSTFTDIGPGPGYSGNNIAFTGAFSNGTASSTGSSETSNVYTAPPSGTGLLLSDSAYLTICETQQSNGTGTDNISVSFNFTAPGTGGKTIGGTDTISITVVGRQDELTGAINWSQPSIDIPIYKTGTSTLIDTVTVALTDVKAWDSADAHYNECSGDYCATVGATFTVDPVPEPASMALLGVGMIGTGVIARRRRSVTNSAIC